MAGLHVKTLITRRRSQRYKRDLGDCGLVSYDSILQYRVVSSVVERLVYTEDVGGSKPSPPTFTSF